MAQCSSFWARWLQSKAVKRLGRGCLFPPVADARLAAHCLLCRRWRRRCASTWRPWASAPWMRWSAAPTCWSPTPVSVQPGADGRSGACPPRGLQPCLTAFVRQMPALPPLQTACRLQSHSTELMASSPKLSGIDLSKLLTPAATLRPRAAQRCVTKQVRAWEGRAGRLLCWLLAPCSCLAPSRP